MVNLVLLLSTFRVILFSLTLTTELTVLLDFELLTILSTKFRFILLLDFYRLAFLCTVTLISTSVYTFSSSYIIIDKYIKRFHYLLSSFVLSIVLLILRPNLVRILLGWDGLGIRSYLLVIYYTRPKAYNAGIITFISNRIGDALIIISLCYVFSLRGIRMFTLHYEIECCYWVIRLIVVAACTKRAQIPFSAWLPAAIAAPTPVSSLVHSSTLVTAGVYLIFRFEALLILLKVNGPLLILGSLTIFIARLSAFFEIDIKKIVALSTLSQLGVIITAMGAGFSILGFFHLLTHAFFKALLFISAGNLIHSSERYQDIRTIGGTREVIPLTKRVIIGASMRLCGLPFISAFYSKELIIERLLVYDLPFYAYSILMIGILITVFYRIRFITVSLRWISRQRALFNKSDSDYITNLSILILLAPAVRGGRTIGSMVKFNSLFMAHERLKLSNHLLILTGGLLFFIFYKIKIKIFKTTLWRLSRLWTLPFFSSRLPLLSSMRSGDFLHKLSDFSWVYFIFTNFFPNSSVIKSSSVTTFEKRQFMRVLSNIVILALTVLTLTA